MADRREWFIAEFESITDDEHRYTEQRIVPFSYVEKYSKVTTSIKFFRVIDSAVYDELKERYDYRTRVGHGWDYETCKLSWEALRAAWPEAVIDSQTFGPGAALQRIFTLLRTFLNENPRGRT